MYESCDWSSLSFEEFLKLPILGGSTEPWLSLFWWVGSFLAEPGCLVWEGPNVLNFIKLFPALLKETESDIIVLLF